MACDESLMNQLSSLVEQIDKGPSCCPPPACCPPACCPPCDNYIRSYVNKPYVQCTMLCAPPCLIPTEPQPVKPLQLPCPKPPEEGGMTEEQALKYRYANFYNNYNVDYHNTGCDSSPSDKCCPPEKRRGTTLDGSNPCCDDYTKAKKKQKNEPLPGCPTGFKPCKMLLTPPQPCDPAGIWCAQIQACPPKPRKKVSNWYKPKPCKRPGCKHWKSKEGECIYDKPCKAHCYNHPQGMKAKVH